MQKNKINIAKIKQFLRTSNEKVSTINLCKYSLIRFNIDYTKSIWVNSLNSIKQMDAWTSAKHFKAYYWFSLGISPKIQDCSKSSWS